MFKELYSRKWKGNRKGGKNQMLTIKKSLGKGLEANAWNKK